MAYKPNYATGDLIDVNVWQELVNRAIYIFADAAARDNGTTGITSPTEGQFCYLLDAGSGSGAMQYYNGSAWANTSLTADITGVTAGNGLSGGGTTGDVSLALDANELSTATAVSTDYVVIEDVTDNSTKKALISDIISQGDITGITTSGTSGLAGGVTSGDANLVVDPSSLSDGSGITVDTANDLLILEDVTDGTVYKVKPSQIASGSANALEDGDSDLTITDGLTNGLDYDLDNTDVATWNNAGIQLTTNGGIYHNTLIQAQNYTVAAGTGAMAVGGLSFTGTVTVAGTLVVL
jgi:hypothetical protein